MSKARFRFSEPERYIDHLKDIATSNFYRFVIPYEADLMQEAEYGELLWHSETPIDGMEMLIVAVARCAVADYAKAYLDQNEFKMLECETFFHQNDFLQTVFDNLQWIIRNAKSEWEINRLTRLSY